MERTLTLARHIATSLQALQTCRKTGNRDWERNHLTNLAELSGMLPSGAGIDAGCKIDVERSGPECIRINTSFHHMNDGGYYDGWTEHTVTVRPSLVHGLDITVSGRDRNEIKDYLADTFAIALRAEVIQTAEGYHWPKSA